MNLEEPGGAPEAGHGPISANLTNVTGNWLLLHLFDNTIFEGLSRQLWNSSSSPAVIRKYPEPAATPYKAQPQR